MEFVSNNNIKLPLIGIGTFTMKGEQLINVVESAIQLGYSLFDTATKYGNELDLGGIIKKRGDVIIQSKVHAEQLLGNIRYLRFNKKSINKSFELSGMRLKRPPDIYFLHSVFKGFKSYLQKLIVLRESGKVKAIGVCNIEYEQIKNLIESTGVKPDVVQVEIHPYFNNRVLVDYCREHDILVEARSPLAHGDIMVEWQVNNILEKIALKYNKSVAQVILRWIIQQNVVAIVRSTNPTHLRDNINIFDFNLTNQEMDDIDSLNKGVSFGYVSSRIKLSNC